MSLLKRLEKEKMNEVVEPQVIIRRNVLPDKPVSREKNEMYNELKQKTLQKVIEDIDLDAIKGEEGKQDAEHLEKEITSVVDSFLDEQDVFIARTDKNRIIAEIINESIGFGPIHPLIHDPTVSEIMVNGPSLVYVERKGKLELTNIHFRDDAHVMHIIEKIVSPLGRRIDESSPMVDARLPDGSRVNAIIPPLALNGPTITIRKFSEKPLLIQDLIRFGTISQSMADFLKACVLGRLNIIVSGGTGSGKTTSLNVLSSFIPADERIVTVEDAAELQLFQEHVVRLETRPANIEGKGAIGIRDLVKNCLRMRPDRIVVGEVRSGEALDMLQAMNTGHDGSLTTGHANSPRDMIARLETMVLMAGMDLPVKAIREQISSAVDLIVQQSRLKDGSRKITHITEVQGMEGEVITLQDLFVFQSTGRDEKGKMKGEFRSTGIRPRFMEKLESSGILLPQDVFRVN